MTSRMSSEWLSDRLVSRLPTACTLDGSRTRSTAMATPVRGMSTRAVQAEQTRQQILDTAQRLFAELGYDATSLQMIADEMGLTKAAVYYHFRAKSDILRAAMQPGIQRLEALLDEAAGIRDGGPGSST